MASKITAYWLHAGTEFEVNGVYYPSFRGNAEEPPEEAWFDAERFAVGGVDITELVRGYYIRRGDKFIPLWDQACIEITDDCEAGRMRRAA